MKWPIQYRSVAQFRIVRRISFFMAAVSICGLLNPAMEGSTAAQDPPTIAKDSVQVTAFTFNVYRKSYDTWGFTPTP